MKMMLPSDLACGWRGRRCAQACKGEPGQVSATTQVQLAQTHAVDMHEITYDRGARFQCTFFDHRGSWTHECTPPLPNVVTQIPIHARSEWHRGEPAQLGGFCRVCGTTAATHLGWACPAGACTKRHTRAPGPPCAADVAVRPAPQQPCSRGAAIAFCNAHRWWQRCPSRQSRTHLQTAHELLGQPPPIQRFSAQ
jgi:hypothetical protein